MAQKVSFLKGSVTHLRISRVKGLISAPSEVVEIVINMEFVGTHG